ADAAAGAGRSRVRAAGREQDQDGQDSGPEMRRGLWQVHRMTRWEETVGGLSARAHRDAAAIGHWVNPGPAAPAAASESAAPPRSPAAAGAATAPARDRKSTRL